MSQTTIAVANLKTSETYFDKFEVECHSDTTGASKLSSQTCTGTYDATSKQWCQSVPLYFRGLNVGTTYYFRVRVWSKAATIPSPWSDFQSEVAGDTTPPSAQYAGAISPIHVGGAVRLNPSNVDLDVARFDVYQQTTSGNPTPSVSISPKASNITGVFTLPQITAGIVHYVWARAVDTSGNRQAWQYVGSYTPLADSQVITSQGTSADTSAVGGYAASTVGVGGVRGYNALTGSYNLVSGKKLGGDSGVTANGTGSMLGLGCVPIVNFDVSGMYARVANAINPQMRVVNTTASKDAAFYIDASAATKIWRDGVDRYYLNAAGHGFQGTPVSGFNIYNESALLVADSPFFDAYNSVNNTSTRLVTHAGAANIQYNWADRYYLNATGHGFDLSPAGDCISVNTGIRMHGESPYVRMWDTNNGSNAYFQNHAGGVKTFRDGSLRYMVDSIGHGFEGTPSAAFNLFGSMLRIDGSGWNSVYQYNTTWGDHVESFLDNAGNYGTYRGSATRYLLNNTGHGFDGSPSRSFDVYANEIARVVSGGNAQWRIYNTTAGVESTTYLDNGGQLRLWRSNYGDHFIANSSGIGFGCTPSQPFMVNGRTILNSSNNICLNNIVQAVGSTQPYASSLTVLDQMSITVTTNGNPLLLTFSGTFDMPGDIDGGGTFRPSSCTLQLYRDGTAIGFPITVTAQQGFGSITDQLVSTHFPLDNPGVGSHTYAIKWSGIGSGVGGSMVRSTQRLFQLVELG